MPHRWRLLPLYWSLVACGAEAPVRPAAFVTDSAGARVVVNPAAAIPAGDAWRVHDPPILRIGVVDGPPEYQFFQVPSGAVLSDGTIVVADAGSRQLRAYDVEGRHLWSAGGPGDGPGEFRSLDQHWVISGDSVLAWDFQARRVSVFDPSGTFVRSFAPAGGAGGTTPFLAGVLSNSGLVIRYGAAYTPADMEPGPSRRRVEIRLADRHGAARVSLGEFPASENLVLTLADGSPAVTLVVFGRTLHVSAAGGRVAVANTDAYSVRVYDSAGRILHVVRLDREPRPVREEDFRALVEQGLDTDVPILQEMMRERFRQTPRHATFPAFASIRLDRSANLWVQDYRPPGIEQPVWHVFGPDGAFVARVETPIGLRVLDVGEDYVLGVHVDDLAVESVHLYRLDRNPT